MKVFILGMTKSGRTTVAKALCQEGYEFIDASSWIKCTFRDQKPDEHIQQYQDEYQDYLTSRLRSNHQLVIDNVSDVMSAYNDNSSFVIDGITSPRDFVHLFDFENDYVVFLNRTDNEAEYKDCDRIGLTVMRDYCFWMSSSGLLDKPRWIEYNFRIPGEESNAVKILGSKNSVFIVKSINTAISHLKDVLKKINLPDHQS